MVRLFSSLLLFYDYDAKLRYLKTGIIVKKSFSYISKSDQVIFNLHLCTSKE